MSAVSEMTGLTKICRDAGTVWQCRKTPGLTPGPGSFAMPGCWDRCWDSLAAP